MKNVSKIFILFLALLHAITLYSQTIESIYDVGEGAIRPMRIYEFEENEFIIPSFKSQYYFLNESLDSDRGININPECNLAFLRVQAYDSTSSIEIVNEISVPGYYFSKYKARDYYVNDIYLSKRLDGTYNFIGGINPCRNEESPNYLPNIEDFKIVYYHLDPNFDILDSKEYTFQPYDSSIFAYEISHIYEDIDSTILVVYRPYSNAYVPPNDFPDTTMFLQFDCHGNLLKENKLPHYCGEHREVNNYGSMFINDDTTGYELYAGSFADINEFHPHSSAVGVFLRLDSLYNYSNYQSVPIFNPPHPYFGSLETSKLYGKRFSDHIIFSSVYFISGWYDQQVIIGKMDSKKKRINKYRFFGDSITSSNHSRDYLAFIHPFETYDNDKFCVGLTNSYGWNSHFGKWNSTFEFVSFDSEINVYRDFFYNYNDHSHQQLMSIKSTIDGSLAAVGIVWDYDINPNEQLRKYDIVFLKYSKDEVLGIESFSSEKTRCALFYPNPVLDNLYIKTSLDDYTIEIYDLSGVLHYSRAHMFQRENIDLSHLLPGTYMIRLLSGGKVMLTDKLIKTLK